MSLLLRGVDVVVIEDDDDSRALLADGLALYGATLRATGTGSEALAMMRARCPEIILCDLGLPDFDGYSLLEQVRADPALRAVAAIALTGYSDRGNRMESQRAGYQKHLVKPAALGDIVAAIDVLRRPRGALAGGDTKTLRTVLAELNAASPCRFTSLLRFADDGTLVSLWTYDREDPDSDPFPLGLPVHASYCQLVHETRSTVTIPNAALAPQRRAHAHRAAYACYIGTPLHRRDGALFGTVCCYDAEPHELGAALRDALEATAHALEPRLWRLFDAVDEAAA